ncbi:MAG: hypothetical protein JO182_32820 [Acidobacteriaceae bacterium]|nr:hypothetical protein [Acidobacteriaceae bacterium]MBV9039312.1 hypothetical protein [Acidobacteriaceae bacterium]MBV9226764.1 hypothetical protein [Acidobacteriaceae bacterium]MBV9679423.1 hypothetical protein [Acidobacteriaceae bacterium]
MAETLPNLPSFHELPSSSRTIVEIVDEQVRRGERILTPLGKKLLEARRRIEQSGIPLLSREELDHERAERRGGVES